MRFSSKQVQHYSLTEKVHELLKHQIINQQLRPGQRLVEDEIAKELGVSRTPVREALYALASDGLVTFVQRKGAYVIQLTRKDVQEIYDIRKFLEGLATLLATPSISDEQLREFAEAIKGIEQKRTSEAEISADIERFTMIDMRLHDVIIEQSQNQRLIQMLSSIHDQIHIFRVWEAKFPDRRMKALEAHKAIFNSIIERNAEKASELMMMHIEDAKQGILERYPF